MQEAKWYSRQENEEKKVKYKKEGKNWDRGVDEMRGKERMCE